MPTITALQMVGIIYVLGVFVALSLLAFGLVSIQIMKEEYGKITEKTDSDRH